MIRNNLPSRSRIHFGCRGVAIDCLPSCVGIGDAYGNECAGLTLLNVACDDDCDKRCASLNKILLVFFSIQTKSREIFTLFLVELILIIVILDN
jgi:hypothetical protein